MFILQQAINGNNKTRRCNKGKVSVKYSEENSVFVKVSYLYLFNFNFNLIVTQVNKWILWWPPRCPTLGEWGGGGRLSTFSAFRMGAYSRWALNRGWAYSNKYGTLIPRNIWQWWLFSDTVCPNKKTRSRPLNCSFSSCWIFKGKNFQALYHSFNPLL